MMPPICAICNKDFRESDDGPPEKVGGLIEFKRGPDDKPLPENVEGHPSWMVWFCARHYRKAVKLAHLTKAEAMKEMKTGCLPF